MTADADTPTPGMPRLFIGASALALIISALPSSANLPSALAGWLAAVLQAGAALYVNRRAVASRSSYFLAWSMGSMAARLGFLLALLAAVRATQALPFAPFAFALIASHLVLLYAEVARLHLDSMALARPDDARLN